MQLDGPTVVGIVGLVAGGVAWMTAMWIRAGRILQKIDQHGETQKLHGTKLDGHETRITRLETIAEES